VANGWTEERRRRQSELIHSWEPWKRSIGPKTAKGKARSSKNAYKHGASEVRTLIQIFKKSLKDIKKLIR
jgi:hypothetical protein